MVADPPIWPLLIRAVLREEENGLVPMGGHGAVEMQIMKYRQFLLLIEDERFRKTEKEKIVELGKKLRDMDE